MDETTQKLGLPIEYQKLPEFFDAHNVCEDTDQKNAFIEKLLNQHSVKTVFDMTCGTGSQVIHLAQKGYDVTGSDLCPALIEQAKKKVSDLQLDVTIEAGDMRTVQLGKFDAVISIFSAIGHLSKSDFELALKNIQMNLKPMGIYVFDIFNIEALTDEVISQFVMDIQAEINGVHFRNQQHSEIDRKNRLLISHDTYTVQKNETVETHKNTFSLRIYSLEELSELLNKNGFDVLECYDMDGNPFKAKESQSLLILARKR